QHDHKRDGEGNREIFNDKRHVQISLFSALLSSAQHVVHEARGDITVLLVHFLQLPVRIFRFEVIPDTSADGGSTAA
ncbi:hypothetical protein N8V88_31695, partial [Enterobacter hormaechei subsp. oharae]|nr:hypothetical protein [Enterobacter hormaechei subsp. oharae]